MKKPTQDGTGWITALALASVSTKHDLWPGLFFGSFSKHLFQGLKIQQQTVEVTEEYRREGLLKCCLISPCPWDRCDLDKWT